MDINDWKRGNGTDALRGNTASELINDNTTNYLQDPLDRLLDNYRRGCVVRYASAATVIIGVGELTLENSAGDARRMRANTTEVTLDVTADLDTGAEQSDQQYYVYAVADADATTFTGIISESDSFPGGTIKYAKKIGFFYNNAAGDITNVGSFGPGSIVQEVGSDDITTSSTAYVDMDDMTVRFISQGGPVRVQWIGNLTDNGTTTQTITARITIDGVEKVFTTNNRGYRNVYSYKNDDCPFPMDYMEVLTAGAHSIAVQWKTSGGTAKQTGATWGQRVLTVQELT